MTITSITLKATDHGKLAQLLLEQGFMVPGNGGYTPAPGIVIGIPGGISLPDASDPPVVTPLPGVYVMVGAVQGYDKALWDARIVALKKKDVYDGAGSANIILGGAAYDSAFPVPPVVDREAVRLAMKEADKAARQAGKALTDAEIEALVSKADVKPAKVKSDAKTGAKAAEL
jgi:hypothetical protein